MPEPRILVVDDQQIILFLLETHLRQGGYHPLLAASGREALALLEEQPVDLMITDLIMPEMGGLELMERVRERFPELPIIVITTNGSVEGAVEAMRRGAYDYVEKPYNPDDLHLTIKRALDYHHVVRENEQIRGLLKERFSFQSIVTANPAMKEVLRLASKVVPARQTTVAIYGESGTGKEVLARAIHFAGKGLPNSFVAVNCAAIPDHLLESELFGHLRGSFTGADRDREGKFSLARGGTLLLDEIGDMPLALQTKLLRVLQERVFERIGSNEQIGATCRVIVATNRNLQELVAAGKFREDLYHRINVFPLTLPPLRERPEDIPILCEHVFEQLRQHLGKPLAGISESALRLLMEYPWPGNVRELRNFLERAAILTEDGEIKPEQVTWAGQGSAVPPRSSAPAAVQLDSDSVSYTLTLPRAELSLEALNERILALTLERCGGNKSKASQMLKIGRKAFYR
ncbi:Fis family transcriptional regulator [Geomonas silvestris]|uniref:Fis family transcriptional regulator n=1 Tax=Geomonas silvestris TaxID=2740184 RepID=A0A6V8MH37_9BACT|nr:sigma-54 dependent transcriptional regulator [Geomonas silvestris]GFO59277.1 Fis family transcriptional regulator [Geomonas silvestris]